jgi:hypothetical protein
MVKKRNKKAKIAYNHILLKIAKSHTLQHDEFGLFQSKAFLNTFKKAQFL